MIPLKREQIWLCRQHRFRVRIIEPSTFDQDRHAVIRVFAIITSGGSADAPQGETSWHYWDKDSYYGWSSYGPRDWDMIQLLWSEP